MNVTATKLVRLAIAPALVVAFALCTSVATANDGADRDPTDPQIAWLLTRFITQVRSIPSDSFVLSQNFLDAYHYVADRGAIVLNEYARDNDPYAQMSGNARIEVEVSSVARTSDDGFRVAWIERHYAENALAESQRWNAFLTVRVTTPSDETRDKTNPFGIYVHAIDWSMQLDAAISNVEP
jgi:type IV secretion system protein VirB5